MNPEFSIITTCKGRLDHLKQSLPAMLAQPDAEVIVVDYSCPDGAAAYVDDNYPDARTVRIDDASTYSFAISRNAGAQVASGKTLVFCDADIILAKDAVTTISRLATGKGLGHFRPVRGQRRQASGSVHSINQLRGFHVIPAAVFAQMNGYDELMEGYAVGADTELENRLQNYGFISCQLPNEIVDRVIDHGDAERMRFHRDPVRLSYATGLIYRRLKTALARLQRAEELPNETKDALYSAAKDAAARLSGTSPSTSLTVTVRDDPVRMPQQLGMNRGRLTIKLMLEISGE